MHASYIQWIEIQKPVCYVHGCIEGKGLSKSPRIDSIYFDYYAMHVAILRGADFCLTVCWKVKMKMKNNNKLSVGMVFQFAANGEK